MDQAGFPEFTFGNSYFGLAYIRFPDGRARVLRGSDDYFHSINRDKINLLNFEIRAAL